MNFRTDGMTASSGFVLVSPVFFVVVVVVFVRRWMNGLHGMPQWEMHFAMLRTGIWRSTVVAHGGAGSKKLNQYQKFKPPGIKHKF